MKFIFLSILFLTRVSCSLTMQNPDSPPSMRSMKRGSAPANPNKAQLIAGVLCCLTTTATAKFLLPHDYIGSAVLGINGFLVTAYAVKEGYSAYYDLKLGMSAEETFKTTLLEKKNQ